MSRTSYSVVDSKWVASWARDMESTKQTLEAGEKQKADSFIEGMGRPFIAPPGPRGSAKLDLCVVSLPDPGHHDVSGLQASQQTSGCKCACMAGLELAISLLLHNRTFKTGKRKDAQAFKR